jgi:hypothetical protein
MVVVVVAAAGRHGSNQAGQRVNLKGNNSPPQNMRLSFKQTETMVVHNKTTSEEAWAYTCPLALVASPVHS